MPKKRVAWGSSWQKPKPLFTYRPKKDVETAEKEKKSKKVTNGKTLDTSTKITNTFDILNSIADFDDDFGKIQMLSGVAVAATAVFAVVVMMAVVTVVAVLEYKNMQCEQVL
ncbi:hypothetical protein Tco_0327291 [Tanacetum coccineum]